MRSNLAVLVGAMALAGCSMLPFGDDDAEAPVIAASPPPTIVATAAETGNYEIKNADRGMVRRVKILLNGRTVDTLVMSKGRTSSSSYCCTTDGCKEIEIATACAAFKMTCDKDGACSEHTTLSRGRL